MEFLTNEQKTILTITGNLKINAVAGSGKTTTLIEYAKAQPASTRILYLAFNKTVKQEAVRKFEAAGLSNVQAETAHSLAYRYVVRGSRYQLHPAGGYKAHELVELLRLPQDSGENRHQEYVLANHILKFVAYFCNQVEPRVQQLDYLATVTDPKARKFVTARYDTIERNCRELLARMERAQVAITHDFYLKKFQLTQPVLPADVILFDEGQDASGVMLDVFFRQSATKVIVGDTHQQIYGWRYAVNSLEKTDYQSQQLSTSFRFGEPIAKLATQVLAWKTQLGGDPQLMVTGAGRHISEVVTRAVIGRTNLGLLLKAIEYVKQHRQQLRRVYFEGNINSYTYAEEGASLYDVLALYNGRSSSIKDPLIRKMANLTELADYAEQTEDRQLQMLIAIVEDYGNEVVELIKELKRLHVADGARDQAQLYFSTVHRCKGLEYDEVQLVPDFITQVTIDKLEEEFKVRAPEPTVWAKVMEEINLLYVALTRARMKVYVPTDSLPTGFQPHADVQVTLGTGGTVLLALPAPPVVIHAQSARQLVQETQEIDNRFVSLQQKLDASGINTKR